MFLTLAPFRCCLRLSRATQATPWTSLTSAQPFKRNREADRVWGEVSAAYFLHLLLPSNKKSSDCTHLCLFVFLRLNYRAQCRLERRGGKCSVFSDCFCCWWWLTNTSNWLNRLIGEYWSLSSYFFFASTVTIQGFKPCFLLFRSQHKILFLHSYPRAFPLPTIASVIAAIFIRTRTPAWFASLIYV